VANRYGLIVGLHLSKKKAIADPENLDDLERLSQRFPRVRWALFHCARSYSAWALERATSRLRNIPNLWYETSSVCETDAFDALFSTADRKRVCYGSDDIGVGITRGKYFSWGHGWTQITADDTNFRKSHCDSRFTFVRYEMVRAIRRAARHARLSRREIEELFYDNAAALVDASRHDLEMELGSPG
jgi:glutamate-1-semialdehyde 2,1-aminomutase